MEKTAAVKLHSYIARWEAQQLTSAEALLRISRVICAVDKQETAEAARSNK